MATIAESSSLNSAYLEMFGHEPLTLPRVEFLFGKARSDGLTEDSLLFLFFQRIEAILKKSFRNFSYYPFSEERKAWLEMQLNGEAFDSESLNAETFQSQIFLIKKGELELIKKKVKEVARGPLLTMEVPEHYSSMLISSIDYSMTAKKNFDEEILFSELCDHPNLVTCYPVIHDDCIVVEKLERMLKSLDKVPYPMIIQMARDVLNGLAYLHTRGLVHGDIHIENIGFQKDRFKVIDFGSMNLDGMPIKGSHPHYWTPERARVYPYTASSHDDIYALAVTVTRLFTRSPYAVGQMTPYFGSRFASLARENHFPEKLGNFLWHCLNEDRFLRLSAEEALEHPIFHGEKPIASLVPKNLDLVLSLFKIFQTLPALEPASVDLADYHESFSFFADSKELFKVFYSNKSTKYPILVIGSQETISFKTFDPILGNLIKSAITSVVGRSLGLVEHRTYEFTEHLPDAYWNLNPAEPWALNHKRHYRRKIYPLAMTLLKQVESINSSRVLEICGGNGEFASCFLDAFEDSIEKYCLFDLNSASITMAKELLSSKEKAIVELGDVTLKATYSALIEKARIESVTLIVGVGALTQQVLPSKAAALSALGHSFDILESGGHILLLGLGISWINKEDLEDAGFIVLETMAHQQYCYLAKKP